MKSKNLPNDAARVILLCLCINTISLAQKPVTKPVTEDDIKANLSLAPCKNEDRLDAAKKLFQSMGATDSDISLDKFKDVQNLVVTKKGKTDDIVIVSAHY